MTWPRTSGPSFDAQPAQATIWVSRVGAFFQRMDLSWGAMGTLSQRTGQSPPARVVGHWRW